VGGTYTADSPLGQTGRSIGGRAVGNDSELDLLGWSSSFGSWSGEGEGGEETEGGGEGELHFEYVGKNQVVVVVMRISNGVMERDLKVDGRAYLYALVVDSVAEEFCEVVASYVHLKEEISINDRFELYVTPCPYLSSSFFSSQ
jgi:hypothetical protein